MVLPLIDEDKPKCFVCHKMFENMEKLKKHQETEHKEFFQDLEKNNSENR